MTTDAPMLRVGVGSLTPAQVVALADGRARVEVDPDPELRARLRKSQSRVQEAIDRGDRIYGVTTGFGESCEISVSAKLARDLQRNLIRYHGAGVGPLLSAREGLAVLAVRLASLCRGYSGVRPALLERLAVLINAGVAPAIPLRGSVGASGDLTPLSYVGAVLQGEREVIVDGAVVPTADALAKLGLDPLRLEPKEGLAIMNGTSVMTALGCLCWERSRRLARLCAALTAMGVDAMRGNPRHFDPLVSEVKPHPGQILAADWIREDLESDGGPARTPARLQDRYSLRCAPQVIGVLLDAATFAERILEIEINSVNDNPIVDGEGDRFVNGGNFFGGHVAMALDTLKTAVANAAGLVERQLALLVNDRTNAGLPANLVAPGDDASARHGFKAMQITASALTADALKLTMPASVFSRSTECHNQDVVSMGTHSAADCLQVLELSEAVGAVCTLALVQAVDLRGPEACGLRARAIHDAVRRSVPMVEADRRQDRDITALLDAYRSDALPIGALD